MSWGKTDPDSVLPAAAGKTLRGFWSGRGGKTLRGPGVMRQIKIPWKESFQALLFRQADPPGALYEKAVEQMPHGFLSL